MNSWQNFLTQQGAQWLDDQLFGFSDNQNCQAIEHSKIPLTDLTLLVIEGPDAQKFLQGQTTCDFNKLDPEHFVLGAHCNAQGRMLSSFLALQLAPERYALRLPRSNLTTAESALKKYIVFAKAKMQVSPWQGFAVLPNQITDQGWRPEQQRVETFPGGVALHYAMGPVEYWAESETLTRIWLDHQQYTSLPPQAFKMWQVRYGFAEVEQATSGEFIPQQFNYQLLGGISFKKGCYTGQEIIARIHYRGQVKKCALRAKVTGPSQPIAIGTAIYSGENHKEVARVIHAAQFANQQEVLLCANRELQQQNGPFEMQNESIKITWQELPYAIPNE